MRLRPFLALPLVAVCTAALACGRAGGQTAEQDSPPPTYTSVPTPLPLIRTPDALPAEDDLRDLIAYANLMGPLLEDVGILLQRDGAILEQVRDGDDELLCDGRLAADNVLMKGIVAGARAIQAPDSASRIHELVLQGGDAWTEAMDDIENFCNSSNSLYKISAATKFWEAAHKIQDAANRFWLLVTSKGIEAWVQR